MSSNNLSAEDLAKVRKLKDESSIAPAPLEDVLEVEFLMKFGFEAYWAIYPEKDRTRGIGIEEMMRLLIASRKQDAKNLYDASQASFIGTVSSNGKNPGTSFTRNTKGIIRDMRTEQNG